MVGDGNEVKQLQGFDPPNLGNEGRDSLKEIFDEPVIGNLEDGRLWVLVDGDDDFGALHPGQMLNSPGDPDGNVQLGRDDLAGLTHLQVARRVSGVAGGAACSYRPAEHVGEGTE